MLRKLHRIKSWLHLNARVSLHSESMMHGLSREIPNMMRSWTFQNVIIQLLLHTYV